ncbi:MAG: HAD family hydrolase [Anaerolineaceae bacterium]|nr:MAG: HAD family hydrolase [Anaerolineaceae bacterium]
MDTQDQVSDSTSVESTGENQWHAATADDALATLEADAKAGLTSSVAADRLEKYGPNELPTREPPTILAVVWHQFTSPLIYILVGAGAVALLLGDFRDAGFIFIVVLLNAFIGTVQEWRAEQSAQGLQNLIKSTSTVRRDGERQQINNDQIVPGDVVMIESGDRVAADLRLVRVRSLRVDESFLTGESVAVDKTTDTVEDSAPVSERPNMVYAGSTVIAGRGVGVAVQTGTRTEVGKIAQYITEEEGGKPPLVIRTEKFAQQIAIIVVAFASLMGAILLLQGADFSEVFFIAVAMAVSAIPEGLPVALTVVLSIATTRMARRNVIVRRLNGVESLGSCTLIASDKTGTLTVNQQTARRVLLPDGRRVEISGEGYSDEGDVRTPDGDALPDDLQAELERITRAGALCNEATLSYDGEKWRHQGDAMDVALLAMAHKVGLDPDELEAEHEVVAEIPFESEQRYAAKAYRKGDQIEVAVKGATEAIIEFTEKMIHDGEIRPLDADHIQQQAEKMAEGGYRVLAIATGKMDSAPEDLTPDNLPRLTLLGLVGFIDPLRPEAKESVAQARNAGVKVVMITGDHPATAFSIASDLDIAQEREQVMTGQAMSELRESDPDAYQRKVQETTVFARVSPEQKLHIVDALIESGEYVAVTGDGVNDAPALRKANIGVAMGSGTDVAKDTATMIVTDDDFASIVAGIEEGRYAYANIRKVTLLLISTGAAELLLITLAILAQFPLPLLAVQILWLNLVTNGIQDIALAFEAGEKRVMQDPPRRPDEGLFNQSMIRQMLVAGVTMGLVCFGFWIYMMNAGFEEAEARNILLALLVLMQFWHVLNCRSETRSAFRVPLRNNRVLIVGMFVAFGLHVLATELPLLQDTLDLQPIAWQNWLFLALVASVVLLVMEIQKRVVAMREEKQKAA